MTDLWKGQLEAARILGRAGDAVYADPDLAVEEKLDAMNSLLNATFIVMDVGPMNFGGIAQKMDPFLELDVNELERIWGLS